MAKRPYLDDLQTARLWAKVKALVSPLSSRVTTLEGQVQTNTCHRQLLERGFHQPLRRGGHWCVE